MNTKLLAGILSCAGVFVLVAESSAENLGLLLKTDPDKYLSIVESANYRRHLPPLEKQPSRGSKDAKITIVEGIDYCCPGCRHDEADIKELLKNYHGKVRLVVLNTPVQQHKNAPLAARVAMSAYNQGKFWPVHEKLLEWNLSGSLFSTVDGYIPYLKTVPGFDVERFKADVNSPEVDAMLAAEHKVQEKFRIFSTPQFFVNGVAILGAGDLLRKEIDRELSRVES